MELLLDVHRVTYFEDQPRRGRVLVPWGQVVALEENVGKDNTEIKTWLHLSGGLILGVEEDAGALTGSVREVVGEMGFGKRANLDDLAVSLEE